MMRRLWRWLFTPAFPKPRPWTWAELQRMKRQDAFSKALGGDVIIPVSGPAEAFNIYRQRQAEIRRRP